MYRYRVIFIKEGDFTCLSHLDLQRTFIRALRRAGVPLAFSQGFNPQPRLSFAAPLAVGIESDGEYLEFDLTLPRESDQLKSALNRQLPPELAIRRVQEVDPDAPFLTSLVQAALYIAVFPNPVAELASAVQSLKESAVLEVERKGNNAKKRVDIRPFIYSLHLQNASGESKLFMFLATGNQGGARPGEVLKLLPLQDGLIRVRRLAIFVQGPKDYITPEGETLSAYLDRMCINT
ncbi:MAG: TIGR03936 family radical SAM-associated protein [Bacillota bacterium]